MTIDVRARELQPGDWLLGSQRRVVRVFQGAYTPRGYVTVDVERNGTVHRYEWRTSTTMRIERGA